MAQVSNLLRRGSSYSARIRVPNDLVLVLGKNELVKALGTSDLTEAKRRLYPQLQAWQREFDDLRTRAALTDDDRAHAVWGHYTATLDRDERERIGLPTETDIEMEMEKTLMAIQRDQVNLDDPLAVLVATIDLQVLQHAGRLSAESRRVKLAEMQKHLAQGNTVLIEHEVDAFLAENNLLVDRLSPQWISLARHMMRAEIDALQRTLERDQGDYTGQPRDPLVKPATGQRRETAKPGQSIMEIFEVFASENPRGVANDRVNQCRRDISTFVEMVGSRFPIGKITKVEVRNWKQLLVKYPIKATETKAFAGMNINQIIKANEKVGKPVIADRTVNRYLSSLGAFLAWAVNNGYLDRNPTEGLMLKKETKAATKPFNSDQLQALFNSPWFTGCLSSDEWRNVAKPGSVLIRDHRYWVPLIMLFSGARPGEIGQLAVNDVRQQHGHWTMHITTEGDETEAGKSVKSAGSMRVVPIHPVLVRLGFLDYHHRRVAEGGTQLFPGAIRNDRGQMMADVSREFGRYLTKIGLKNGRGLSLYSFRHGAADALRRAGYLDQQFGFILGHTEATMTGKYGIMPQGMLDQRVELINSISYSGLNIDHLVVS
jgi:integrase